MCGFAPGMSHGPGEFNREGGHVMSCGPDGRGQSTCGGCKLHRENPRQHELRLVAWSLFDLQVHTSKSSATIADGNPVESICELVLKCRTCRCTDLFLTPRSESESLLNVSVPSLHPKQHHLLMIRFLLQRRRRNVGSKWFLAMDFKRKVCHILD